VQLEQSRRLDKADPVGHSSVAKLFVSKLGQTGDTEGCTPPCLGYRPASEQRASTSSYSIVLHRDLFIWMLVGKAEAKRSFSAAAAAAESRGSLAAMSKLVMRGFTKHHFISQRKQTKQIFSEQK